MITIVRIIMGMLIVGMTELGAVRIHVLSLCNLRLHRLWHCMRVSRQQAEAAHHYLHGKPYRHQADETMNMQFPHQHAKTLIPYG